MHSISHQFPIAQEKARKPIEWEKPGKLATGKILQNSSYVEKLRKWYLYFSHNTGAFFPLYFYLMVYLITQKMHGFSHQFSKVSEKTANPIEQGKSGKLVSKHFQLNRCFFYQIPILWYTLSYGKCMSFLIIFPQLGKSQENPSNGKSLENQSKGKSSRPIASEKPGKLVLILFTQYGCFFPIRFPSYGILHNM